MERIERERMYVYPANMTKDNVKYGFIQGFEIDSI